MRRVAACVTLAAGSACTTTGSEGTQAAGPALYSGLVEACSALGEMPIAFDDSTGLAAHGYAAVDEAEERELRNTTGTRYEAIRWSSPDTAIRVISTGPFDCSAEIEGTAPGALDHLDERLVEEFGFTRGQGSADGRTRWLTLPRDDGRAWLALTRIDEADGPGPPVAVDLTVIPQQDVP